MVDVGDVPWLTQGVNSRVEVELGIVAEGFRMCCIVIQELAITAKRFTAGSAVVLTCHHTVVSGLWLNGTANSAESGCEDDAN